MVKAFELLLLAFLIVCALSVSLTGKVFTAVIIFMSYSTVMAVLWVSLQAPDLALTEAAVGAGVTTILFFVALRKVKSLQEDDADGTHE